MNRNQLLKILLPGLFPLLMFILVDELYGTSAGLVVAVSFGLAQFLYTYVKNKTVDTFVLFDTLLIVVLGCISYLLDNDIFFKLKPALVGGVACVLLGVSAFSTRNLFVLLFRRYFAEFEFNEEQVRQLGRSARVLFYLFSFHTSLVVYSAFLMSTEAWAFISTVLLYLLLGAYAAYELVKNGIARRRFQREEWLPVVDEKGTVTGKAPRSIVHQRKDLLHPVVHLHVIDTQRKVFLQKRPMTKAAEPGKWDTSVGGHVGLGETIEAALHRESEEEIGLRNFTAVPLGQYILRAEKESELVFVFYAAHSHELVVNGDEVDEGRFWTVSEIDRHRSTGSFTPSFLIEYDMLRKRKLL